jgi:hypothetical protein
VAKALIPKLKQKTSFFDKLKGKLPFELGKGKKKDEDAEKTPAPAPESTPAPEMVKTPSAPKAPKRGLSDMIKSTLKTGKSPTDDRILDAAPEVDESLLEDIEPPKSILLYVLKGCFAFLIAIGLSAILFFTSQLSTRLDFATNLLNVPSALHQLEDTNDEISTLQTDLNMYKFLEGKFYLNQISYYGDEYLRSYYIAGNKTMSDDEREEAVEEIEDLRVKIVAAFKAASVLLTQDKGIVLADLDIEAESDFEGIFSDFLQTRFAETAEDLSDSENPDDVRDYKLYNQTKKLVSNSDLVSYFKAADVDALSELDLAFMIMDVNELVENELSTIQKIKESRINWSDIINQIELETTYVDQYFSEGYYDEIGGIQYTSYDFDTDTGLVTITGVTKRFDTNNFTMISNLIDQLNSSPYFSGVEMKSFTKSGSAEEGFTSTLRLNLYLQKDALEDLDEQISPEEIPEFLEKKAGISISGVETSNE